MGFFLFLGRVFFASLIIVSAWQILWVTFSNIEVRQASVTIVSMIAIGGVIFVIKKLFGAYLAVYFTIVSPILYDIYNNGPEDRYFSPFWIELFKNAALQLQIFRSYKAEIMQSMRMDE
ncbi:unnamed protein product [Brassica rapa subsp. trilocularis]